MLVAQIRQGRPGTGIAVEVCHVEETGAGDLGIAHCRPPGPPGEGRQQLVRRVTPALLLLAAGFLVACVAFRMDSPNALEVVAVVVALMIGAITARCLDSRLQSP